MASMKHAPRISAETFSAKFAVAEADEAAGTFRGMASVFGAPIDTYPPTVIDRGAFAKTLAEQGTRVKILWQHNLWEPIGRPTSLRETEDGLEVVGRLDPIELGIRAMTQIKSGTLTDLSIGFDPVKWEMEQTTRHLKEVRLWEVSVVTFGAQRAATMTAFAQAFRDLPMADRTAWDPVGAAERVRAWANGDPERLFRAYLAAGTKEDSGRFQIADVIDGKLVVIPAAVFAAALALPSAEDLTPRVREYAQEHLAAYYRKLGHVAPWENDRASVRVLLEPLASLPAEQLEGRKLSTRSKGLVEDAIERLRELLDSAEPAPVAEVPAAEVTPPAIEAPAPSPEAPAVEALAEAASGTVEQTTEEVAPDQAALLSNAERRLKEMRLAVAAGALKTAA